MTRIGDRNRLMQRLEKNLVQAKVQDGMLLIWMNWFRQPNYVKLIDLQEITGTIKVTGGTGVKGEKGDTGAAGKNIELQKNSTHVQWRVEGATVWNNLIDLADLKGATGEAGPAGADGADGVDGSNGRNIELQNNETHIQWRLVGDSSWINLVPLESIKGTDGINGSDGADGVNGTNGNDGREIELQKSATHVQWRYAGDAGWTNLILLSELKGDTGTAGTNGTNGIDGKQVEFQKTATHIQWRYVGDISWTNLVALTDIKGDTGATGAAGPTGPSGADGRLVALSGDVTNNSTTTYSTVFTIALDANSSHYISCKLIAETNTSGGAVQVRARIDQAGTTGYAFFITPTTATAAPFDQIALSTNPVDTGETAILAANIPIPIIAEVALKTGVTPGNLIIEFQAEVSSTVTIRKGSHYIRT